MGQRISGWPRQTRMCGPARCARHGSCALRRTPSRRGLTELGPQRVIDDNGPASGECFHLVTDIAGHDSHHAWPDDLSHAINGHLDLALDHLPDFLLRMEVLV